MESSGVQRNCASWLPALLLFDGAYQVNRRPVKSRQWGFTTPPAELRLFAPIITGNLPPMNALQLYIRKMNLNECQVMNLLQDHGIISDNCVNAADVASEDCGRAVEFASGH